MDEGEFGLPKDLRHAFYHGRYQAALMAIMEFGYGDGHAKGFTCADMAADALGEPRKKRSGDRSNQKPPA